MRHTTRQTTRRTLTDLYRAMEKRTAVTVSYTDHDGQETVRTIEIYDLRTTKNGHIEIHAMCRLRGEARRFLLNHVTAYTVHRIAFVLDHTAATTPSGRTIVVRSERQLIARELGRDYLPKTPVTRATAALAA